jgi:hypothetical protein
MADEKKTPPPEKAPPGPHPASPHSHPTPLPEPKAHDPKATPLPEPKAHDPKATPLTSEQVLMIEEQVKAAAKHALPETEVRVAKLIVETDKSGKKIDAPPKPPVADAGGPVPRTVHQNERSPTPALTRFKLKCISYHPQPVRYVLARDKDEAEQHYLKATRLDQAVALASARGPMAEPPVLVVTTLVD